MYSVEVDWDKRLIPTFNHWKCSELFWVHLRFIKRLGLASVKKVKTLCVEMLRDYDLFTFECSDIVLRENFRAKKLSLWTFSNLQ